MTSCTTCLIRNGDTCMFMAIDEQMIINIIHRHIKQMKLIIYCSKFKTSNLIVKNNTGSPKTSQNQTSVFMNVPLGKNTKINTYISHTTTTLSCGLAYHLSDTRAINLFIECIYIYSFAAMCSAGLQGVVRSRQVH